MCGHCILEGYRIDHSGTMLQIILVLSILLAWSEEGSRSLGMSWGWTSAVTVDVASAGAFAFAVSVTDIFAAHDKLLMVQNLGQIWLGKMQKNVVEGRCHYLSSCHA